MKEGQSIGPYRILRKLGEGGMGIVFEAVHQAIERHVAIKVLHPEYAKSAEFSTRFVNEARAVNRVDHPGIVQVSDYGQLDDGAAYIVMEYIKGETLRARLTRSRGQLPMADSVKLGVQLADTLAAAHAEGIVHRDLKPDNVMIVKSPRRGEGERTKLLDFGIAKLFEDNPEQVKTKTTAVMGTPVYMSPEQCRGAGGVDTKSDVYSLGVMMYLMLSGRAPFSGEGVGEILGKHMYEEPPPLAGLAPRAPACLVELVHCMLRKDKKQRPDMSQVAGDLDAIGTQFLNQVPSTVQTRLDAPNISIVNPTLLRPSEDSARFERLSTLGQSAGQSPLSQRRRTVAIMGTGVMIVSILALGGRALVAGHGLREDAALVAGSATAVKPDSLLPELQAKARELPNDKVTDDRGQDLLGQPAGEGRQADSDQQPAEPKHAVPPASGQTDDDRAGMVGKKSSRDRDAPALVEQGRIKLNDGDPETATGLFKLALGSDPRSSEAAGGLGRASFELGNLKAALRYLDSAIRLAPRKSLAYQELRVQVLYKLGRPTEAAEACHKLLAQAPGSAVARQILEMAERELHIGVPARATSARSTSIEPGAQELRRPPGFGSPSVLPQISITQAAGNGIAASGQATREVQATSTARPLLKTSLTAQELFDHSRYTSAIEAGQREARGGAQGSWRIVGLAACKTLNASAATEAYRAATFETQRQIAYACADSGYKLINGAFRSLYGPAK